MAVPETSEPEREPTGQSEANCARIWSEFETTFERALSERTAPLHEAYFEFAGHPVRLRALGPTLGQHLTRPFAHLRVGPRQQAELALRADLWDECATGLP